MCGSISGTEALKWSVQISETEEKKRREQMSAFRRHEPKNEDWAWGSQISFTTFSPCLPIALKEEVSHLAELWARRLCQTTQTDTHKYKHLYAAHQVTLLSCCDGHHHRLHLLREKNNSKLFPSASSTFTVRQTLYNLKLGECITTNKILEQMLVTNTFLQCNSHSQILLFHPSRGWSSLAWGTV